MKKLLTCLAWLILPLPALAGDGTVVPSGQSLWPYEVLWEDHQAEGETGETWLILRFLAPEISKSGGRISYDDAVPDLDFLCREIGLSIVDMTGGGVDQIIVNLLDQPIPRGLSDADVTQFMSFYRVENGDCIWD